MSIRVIPVDLSRSARCQDPCIAVRHPLLVNEFDDGFHQVILNEVKNLIISAHEIHLPPRRDQDD